MRRLYKRLVLPGLILASLPATAAEPIFSFDFEDERDVIENFNVFDGNSDNIKWTWGKYTTGSRPYYYAQCYAWAANTYNDSMTTKEAYHLQKGHAYALSFDGWADTTPASATFAVGYFLSSDENNIVPIISKVLPFINKYNGDDPNRFEALFEVEEDGDYQFIFMVHGNEKCGGAAIDNLVLIDAGSPSTPAPASSVEAVAAEDFSLSATLSIALPSKTVTGSDIAENGISKVEVYRGETLAATLTSGLVPGQTISWTDANAVAGSNTYKVIVYNGDLASAATETTVYVGPLTPTAPTSVKAAKAEGGKILITWSAPVKSTEGEPLRPELISYNVKRVVNGGEPVALASGITATQFEDTFSSEDLVRISYIVEALYSGRDSEDVATNEVVIGSYTLPYAESFANAVLPEDWEIKTNDTSTYSPKMWKVGSKMASSPSASPYDDDGGLLTYNSYSINSSYWSQAITPEIKIKDVAAPVLSFYFYHSTNSSTNKDRIVIEISKDGGEFEEIENSEIIRPDGSTGWKLHEIPLASYNDAENVRISFKALSAYGADMAIDAIRVYAGKGYDLEAGALEAETDVNVGQEAEFKFTVNNIAFANVKGENYTVRTYLGGELNSEIEGRDIAPGASEEFIFTIPTHAGHVEGGLPVYAEIIFDADEDQTNNESNAIQVNVNSYNGETVSEVRGELSGSTLRLSWDAIEVEEFEPLTSEITLDREEDIITKEDFENDNSIAWPATFTAIDGSIWQNIDKDDQDVKKQFGVPAEMRGFMVSNKNVYNTQYNVSYDGDADHGFLVAKAPTAGNGLASDYLVSPKLPGKGNHKLEFMGKTLTYAQTADFYVEYTAADTFSKDDIEEKFIPVGEKIHIENNGRWELYSFDIPSDAKYVAIHFVGEHVTKYPGTDYEQDTPSVLFVDNLKLTSTPIDAPTFNVYYREITSDENGEVEIAQRAAALYSDTPYVKAPQKHNDAPIVEPEYVLAAPSVATDFHVSAVYPQGETKLSAPFSHNVTTGISSASSVKGFTVRVEGRAISASENGMVLPINVYTVDGSAVAINTASFTVATPGVYVVKANSKAVTVVIK